MYGSQERGIYQGRQHAQRTWVLVNSNNLAMGCHRVRWERLIKGTRTPHKQIGHCQKKVQGNPESEHTRINTRNGDHMPDPGRTARSTGRGTTMQEVRRVTHPPRRNRQTPTTTLPATEHTTSHHYSRTQRTRASHP